MFFSKNSHNDDIIEEIKGFASVVSEMQPGADPLRAADKKFAYLLCAVSSDRPLPGIPAMELELAVCEDSEKEAAQKELFARYGVNSAQTLAKVCNERFFASIEFDSFRAFWGGYRELSDEQLSSKNKHMFESAMVYAQKLYAVVGNSGFLAWDLNERIGLCRKALAAGIVTESEFWKMTNGAVQRAAVYFGSWGEYAQSCLAGAAYSMFRSASGTSSEQKQDFDQVLETVNALISPGGHWQRYSWPRRTGKNYALKPKDIVNMLPSWKGPSSCIATDRIVVDGEPVGYMYRQEPAGETDSGWRFAAGDETDDYMGNPGNIGVYTLNTIANGDPSVATYLRSPIGSAYIRNEMGVFVPEQFFQRADKKAVGP